MLQLNPIIQHVASCSPGWHMLGIGKGCQVLQHPRRVRKSGEMAPREYLVLEHDPRNFVVARQKTN